MGFKEHFEYDSVQDQETIARCLQAIMEGFDKGHLVFSHRDKSVHLEPCGLLRFALEASAKGKMRTLKLKVKWEQSNEGDRGAVEPLKISTEPELAESGA